MIVPNLAIAIEILSREDVDGQRLDARGHVAIARCDGVDESGELDGPDDFVLARILLQDMAGFPAINDFAAMRNAAKKLGGEPSRIEPLVPVDLVVDHSVEVDVSGQPDAVQRNMEIEFQRNGERYAFLKWGKQAFGGIRIVPPGNAFSDPPTYSPAPTPVG